MDFCTQYVLVLFTEFFIRSQKIICFEQPSSDLCLLPQAFNTAPSALELLATHFATWALPIGPHDVHLNRNNMRGMHPDIVWAEAAMWDCITPLRRHIPIGGCFNLGRHGWTAVKMPDGVYDAPSYDGDAFDKDVPPNRGADQQPLSQGNNTTLG
eukprot:1572141-Ditylum_brightwellii.AAC.1